MMESISDISTKSRKRESLSRYVFQDLKRKIVEKEIETGDYLKSESELSKEYQVSRTTIRDAISNLEESGFVEKQHGKGILVINRSADVLIEAIQNLVLRSDYTQEELMETRNLLERRIVVLATRNATPQYIDTLKRYVLLMNQEKDRMDKYTEYDFNFHLTLAKMSNNRVLYAIVLGLYPLLWKMVEEAVVTGGKMEQTHSYHAKILNAIEQGKEDEAHQQMINHLSATWEIMESKTNHKGNHEIASLLLKKGENDI